MDAGFAKDQVAQVYGDVQGTLSDGPARLAWADAIVDLFGDRQWARQALTALLEQADAALRPQVAQALQRRAGQ